MCYCLSTCLFDLTPLSPFPVVNSPPSQFDAQASWSYPLACLVFEGALVCVELLGVCGTVFEGAFVHVGMIGMCVNEAEGVGW